MRSYIETTTGTEKSFGVVFAIVFLLAGLYPLMIGEGASLWLLAFSFILVMTAYLAPRILVIPNRAWFKLGLGLGVIIAPIVMFLVYISTVIPIGLIMRIFGKDLLFEFFTVTGHFIVSLRLLIG